MVSGTRRFSDSPRRSAVRAREVRRGSGSPTSGASLTVDHVDRGDVQRAAVPSLIRTPHRVVVGTWGLESGRPRVALSEPGAAAAIAKVRALAAVPALCGTGY
jgi:hypothetical protein